MRSLFWRILASFWLAITLVAGLSILLGHMLNQDAWILSRHPGLNTLASKWAKHYEPVSYTHLTLPTSDLV